MLDRCTRPSRGEIDEAALALLARHGATILATARRYAASHEDAEDAYQRALEILLTKAPTTSEDELVPWLKTVVKHEAFALRRQRERLTPVTGDGEPPERGTAPAATHDQAERYERLRHSAEALRRLKPQEVRCLVLRAQGLSYREICQATGFTYTKVNRCLTEGRQALSVRLAGIEGGLGVRAPGTAAVGTGRRRGRRRRADAPAPAPKTCLSCRARLREFRAVPGRVAALVPHPVPHLSSALSRQRALPTALEAFTGALHRPSPCSALPSTRPPRSASARTPRPSWSPARRSRPSRHRGGPRGRRHGGRPPCQPPAAPVPPRPSRAQHQPASNGHRGVPPPLRQPPEPPASGTDPTAPPSRPEPRRQTPHRPPPPRFRIRAQSSPSAPRSREPAPAARLRQPPTSPLLAPVLSSPRSNQPPPLVAVLLPWPGCR